jgi:hypothetical protein
MVPVMNAVHSSTNRLGLGWRSLAWLCCALMLAGPGSPALSAFGLAHAPVTTESESEERAPTPSDDDDSEGGKVSSASVGRLRHHKRVTPVVSTSWLAHLPHHHGGQPGYSLPICTPFERGNNPRLRC